MFSACQSFHESPVGWLCATWQPQDKVYALSQLTFCGPNSRGGLVEDGPGNELGPDRKTIAQLDKALEAFFAGEANGLDWAEPFLRTVGTEFQRQVWTALTQIPRGQVRSYAQIAASLNNPRAMRAVAQACRKNPLCLFIPCHRVVGQAGKKYTLGGFMGGMSGGLDIKRRLLEIEDCALVQSTPALPLAA